jgi:hypothetical protein
LTTPTVFISYTYTYGITTNGSTGPPLASITTDSLSTPGTARAQAIFVYWRVQDLPVLASATLQASSTPSPTLLSPEATSQISTTFASSVFSSSPASHISTFVPHPTTASGSGDNSAVVNSANPSLPRGTKVGIGIAVAGFCLLVIIIAFALFIRRKRRRRVAANQECGVEKAVSSTPTVSPTPQTRPMEDVANDELQWLEMEEARIRGRKAQILSKVS